MSTGTLNPKRKSQVLHAEREFQKKFFEMGRCCYYCGTPLLLRETHREHKTPKCRGGSDHISNIVPSCADCNRKKAWRTEAEFIKARPGLFKQAQASRCVYKPKAAWVSFEEVNEPGLLKRVRSERDGGVSWAWRNPA